MMEDADYLPALIGRAAWLTGQRLPAAGLDDVRAALERRDARPVNSAALVGVAWTAGRLGGQVRATEKPQAQDCPFIWKSAADGWMIALSRNADGSWVCIDALGERHGVEAIHGSCALLPVRNESREAPKRVSSFGLVKEALWKHRAIFLEALLATALVNLLALAASLYSMQVYDRVIPNRGFHTLFVLTAGVAGAVLLELVLRNLRAHALDRTATLVDLELSEWLFHRALGIRLDRRPATVGTLAAQIKGFELVRGVLGSATLFVLADIPFALFFVLAILAVGGWLALVPLLIIPAALFAGMVYQRRIAAATAASQEHNNRKTGLLVESVDGAESIKANHAEWTLLRRWNSLAAEAGESDESIKRLTASAQHFTASVQQAGYVALVAFGAYLVTENHITMGALIACSIISGRALSPIAQLPSILVQWGHARAAMDGLDKLISLPNEHDDAAHALVPGKLERSLSFSGVRFGYGGADRHAVEVPKLDIGAGECVAVIGAIGSGKSTLLKLASGLYRPAEGRVSLGGVDMALISPQVLRESIAYLAQDVRLVSGTLRENLVAGLPDPGDEALLDAVRSTGLIDLVSSHPKGLALPLSEGGRGISGGQKQLIAFTRLLLAKPAMIILDEPTASMDAQTEARIVALVKELSASGCTLLVATHKTAFFPIIDRLVVVQGGRVALDGPRDMVLAKLAGKSAVAAA